MTPARKQLGLAGRDKSGEGGEAKMPRRSAEVAEGDSPTVARSMSKSGQKE